MRPEITSEACTCRGTNAVGEIWLETARRFLSKVDTVGASPCWAWLGAQHEDEGYGEFRMDGRRVLAHRACFRLFVGAIPDGLDVLHSCDNTRCVNPSHLRAGTHSDNMADKVARGRCSRLAGERHPMHKLTWAQVSEIRDRYASGSSSQRLLADEFKVSQRQILSIVNRESWRQ